MDSWRLVITNISMTKLKAHNVHLIASLSSDECNNTQSTPIHNKGSTFEFTVEGATLLEFKIVKKDSSGHTTDVIGEVDVPVKDLLEKGPAGNMKLKVLTHEARSSSSKTLAALEFSYKFGERFPRQDAQQSRRRRVGRKFLKVGMGFVLNGIVITITGGAVTSL